jgi:flagellin-specific chaperone FliS
MLDDRRKEKWQQYTIVTLLGMLRHYASDYVYILRLLEMCKSVTVFAASFPQERRLEKLQDDRDTIKEISVTCQKMDMPLSVIQCDRAINIIDLALSVSDVGLQLEQMKELQQRIDTLSEIILDELSTKLFYFVSPDLAEFYEINQFSHEVTDRFSGAVYDMEEAGKCLSLGRYTACAFHLMRVVECGLLEFKSFLTIDKNCPSWDSILKALNAHIGSLPSTHEQEKYRKIVSRVYAIKDAWRNPTMHVEYKYNDEEALEVFDATKNFMKVLYEELSQPSSPAD